jgi:hypothetical protein
MPFQDAHQGLEAPKYLVHWYIDVRQWTILSPMNQGYAAAATPPEDCRLFVHLLPGWHRFGQAPGEKERLSFDTKARRKSA